MISKILVVHLNIVYQKIYFIDFLKPNEINIVTKKVETGAGKGIDIARGIKTLGGDPILISMVGGYNGRLCKETINKEKICAQLVKIKENNRNCITIIDRNHRALELKEPKPRVSLKEVAVVKRHFRLCVRNASAVVLAGTLPEGVPLDLFAQLSKDAKALGKKVIMDTSAPVLEEALASGPDYIKINRDELAPIFEKGWRTDTKATIANVRRIQKRGVPNVVITHGPKEVIACHDSDLFQFLPPKVEVKNPIGSGDAFTAGLAISVNRGSCFVDAVKYGIACGTANCQTVIPGHFRKSDVSRVKRQIS